VVLGVVPAHGFYVRGYLAVLELECLFKVGSTRNKGTANAWRTVTGIRAPWSVHREVIPRFRAMTPVRIEFGVHLGGAAGSAGDAELLAAGDARFAPEECRRRTEAASGGLSANAQSFSMEGNKMCLGEFECVFLIPEQLRSLEPT
jgi:hypothetical protein